MKKNNSPISGYKALASLRLGCLACFFTLAFSVHTWAAGFSASFDNADIGEFINTVSAALNKTIIIDPTVKGRVSVRSYKELNEEQYYQLFLSVLEVNGFVVIEQGKGVLKVVRDKDGKTAPLPLVDQKGNPADRMVTWVVPVNNVPVRELSPILRQLNATYGNVVHFNPANVIIITGHASNVERLVSIIERIDQQGIKSVEVVQLEHTSATEMTRILSSVYLDKGAKSANMTTIVANEQGNQVILAGHLDLLNRMKKIALQLDQERASKTGNSRVFYLRYAKAEDLKPVLEGVGELKGSTNSKAVAGNKSFTINVHEQNNALVITAKPDMMNTLAGLIEKLDIRRAQVMVEAIIAEVADGDGINLSLQLAGENGSMIQFNDGSSVPIGEIINGMKEAEDQKGSTVITDDGNITVNPDTPGDYSALANALAKVSGAAFSITSGDWTALLQAVTTSSKSNVLSTPSLMTLDNETAFFIVGDEVPTLTGSTPSDGNDNPYQTIERKEVGIKLEVTPQINEGDAVRLEIEQEVSKVNGQTPVDVTFSTRQVKTSVMVRSGDTVVIGGLIDEDVQESVSKVPLLGDIPVLGHLFRSTSSQKTKRNLMVFIRPTIVRDDDTLANVSAAKYSLIRAEQLKQNERGISLMPDQQTPVLPESGNTEAHKLIEEMRKSMDRQKEEEAAAAEQQKLAMAHKRHGGDR